MSTALDDWYAFEKPSAHDILSTSDDFVQPTADAGLPDLSEIFPGPISSFGELLDRLKDKFAGADNWKAAIDGRFDATEGSDKADHAFAADRDNPGLSKLLDKFSALLDNQPDLQPLFAGTAEGGTASGSSTGFNQALVDQLDSGSYWYNASYQVAQTISYGFTTSSSFAAGYGEQAGWSSFTETQKTALREIMGQWDDLVAPSFVENTGSPNTADIKFSNTTTNNGYAHAYYPGQVDAEAFQFQKIQGSVWLNPNYNSGAKQPGQPDSRDLRVPGHRPRSRPCAGPQSCRQLQWRHARVWQHLNRLAL